MGRERYRQVYLNGQKTLEHRAVWEKEHGRIPAGTVIHHKNGDQQDNRPENLEAMKRGEHNQRHFGVAPKYPVCLDCGKAKIGTEQRHPRCRSCESKCRWQDGRLHRGQGRTGRYPPGWRKDA